jgi:hypothetical protein
MGTRRRNRPVSAAVTNGPLTSDTGAPGARSTALSARDPPPGRSSMSTGATSRPRTCDGRPARGRPPAPAAKKGRDDAATSPLPEAGLAELVQLQLATLPVDPLAAYP